MRRDGVHYRSAIDLACGQSKDWIDHYAAECANALNFEIGADAWELVNRLGGRLQVQDIFSNSFDDDTLFVHGPHDFDMVLSSVSGPRRDRFTIAHELGHYFLHSHQGRYPLVAARSGSDRAEWEANWFAAGFLMPTVQFLAAMNRGDSSRLLAAQFGVSESAAEIRKKVLKGES